MFKYNIINKPLFNINNKSIDKILITINKIVSIEQNGTINIVFLDDDSIKKLNKQYRKIDKVTDVLSFHYFDKFDNLDKKDIAGEIILSQNKIISQATEYGLTKEYEFFTLLIHSILHILGYDHEIEIDYKTMKNLENKIFKESIGLI